MTAENSAVRETTRIVTARRRREITRTAEVRQPRREF
jgi:hypothetical protein